MNILEIIINRYSHLQFHRNLYFLFEKRAFDFQFSVKIPYCRFFSYNFLVPSYTAIQIYITYINTYPLFYEYFSQNNILSYKRSVFFSLHFNISKTQNLTIEASYTWMCFRVLNSDLVTRNRRTINCIFSFCGILRLFTIVHLSRGNAIDIRNTNINRIESIAGRDDQIFKSKKHALQSSSDNEKIYKRSNPNSYFRIDVTPPPPQCLLFREIHPSPLIKFEYFSILLQCKQILNVRCMLKIVL